MDKNHLTCSNQSGLVVFKAFLLFKIIDGCLIYTIVLLCITIDTLAYNHSVQAAKLPANVELTQLIQVGSSTKTEVKRITRPQFDYSYTLDISTIGDKPLPQVKGRLVSLSPATHSLQKCRPLNSKLKAGIPMPTLTTHKPHTRTPNHEHRHE